MDSDDKMVFLLLQKEENATTDHDEHSGTLTALLQMQVDDLRNVTFTCGSSNFGRRERDQGTKEGEGDTSQTYL
jgi:hypothetical protein